MNIESGRQIPIEERGPDEVRQIGGNYITVPEVEVYNPAFDVTPSQLITGIITEAGVIHPPYRDSLIKVKGM
jgi:methylthioribose-1-phosphate isomerase